MGEEVYTINIQDQRLSRYQGLQDHQQHSLLHDALHSEPLPANEAKLFVKVVLRCTCILMCSL